MSTYIIPDIHGCYYTLCHLIENELKVSLNDRLYFLGDYIDRGPRSAEVVDYLLGLKERGFNVNCIKGNHEQLFFNALSDGKDFETWIYNYGNTTLESYRRMLGIENFDSSLIHIPEIHLAFFSSLPSYAIVDDKFVLVHGCLNYRLANPFSDEEGLLWRRPEPIPDSFLPGKFIIHGHTPNSLLNIIENVKVRNNRLIGLDAGCVYKGRTEGFGYLTAFNVETWNLSWVENIDI